LALLYLAIFGGGTIVGMLLVTSTLAVPFAVAARRWSRAHAWLVAASAALSIGFGAFLIYEIGFVDGFFTASPTWTPG
jgi:hypothetical protein